MTPFTEFKRAVEQVFDSLKAEDARIAEERDMWHEEYTRERMRQEHPPEDTRLFGRNEHFTDGNF